MKLIRKRLTYANVMSSIAVFLILGGATAFAATKIGSSEIKGNAITTGKIKKEAVTKAKLKNGSVTTEKIANDAVTGDKANESTFGQVPNAANAALLEGKGAASFVPRADFLWALVDDGGGLVAGSGAVSATRLGEGNFRVTFNRTINTCITEGTATDVTGGAFPSGSSARIIGTDNRVQTTKTTVDVSTTNPDGELEDPAALDGFTVTVYC